LSADAIASGSIDVLVAEPGGATSPGRAREFFAANSGLARARTRNLSGHCGSIERADDSKRMESSK
jgi:hypothetical protein